MVRLNPGAQRRGFLYLKGNLRPMSQTKPLWYWPAISTAGLLSIPLIGGFISENVDWSPFDFLIGGALIFVVASVELLLWRSLPKKGRWPIMLFLMLLFAILWAEMAVGIFGSPIAGS